MYLHKNQVRALGNIINHIIAVWDDVDIALCNISDNKISITTPHPTDNTDTIVTDIIIDNRGDISIITKPATHTWLHVDDIDFLI
jgi:hypothetical protein